MIDRNHSNQKNLVEYLIIRILVIHSIWTYWETTYIIEKLFDTWRHFEHPPFFIFWKKIFFPMSLKVPISPKMPDIADFLGKKFRRYWPSVYIFYVYSMSHTVWLGSYPGDLFARPNPSAAILHVNGVKRSPTKWFRP